MNDIPKAPRSSQTNIPTTEPERTIFGLKARSVALALIIVGFALILGGAFVPEHEGLGWELGHHLLRDLGIAAFISGLLGSAYEWQLRDDYLAANRHAIYDVMMREDILEVNREVVSEAIMQGREELRSKFVADAKTSLQGVLKEQDKRLQQLDQLRKAGLQNIDQGRDIVTLQALFRSEPTQVPIQVRILETWTGHREAGIDEWVRKAVREYTAKVKILLLNPESDQVRYRAAAVDEDVDTIKFSIKADLAKLEKVRRNLHEISHDSDIEIRVYDASPSVNMFRFDDIRIFGLYLYGLDSLNSPQFTVDTSGRYVEPAGDTFKVETKEHFVARLLDDHFDNLWNAKETTDWPPPDTVENGKLVRRPLKEEEEGTIPEILKGFLTTLR